jgi:PTH1 family peptidyl-tRNA hydrolase
MPKMADKFFIVGLGNPGRDYEKTRHNVGFWVIDELVKRHNLGNPAKDRRSLVYTGTIAGKSVVLAKPQTYMNLSGEAVRSLADFYRIPTENILVIHDDLDTPFGTLKLRKQGGHGGQNGVRNILLHLGTENFGRIRFGIGRPLGKMQGKDYVLQGFVGDDVITAQQVTEKAADAAETWLREGIDLAMTRYNGDIEVKSAPKPSLDDEIAVAQRAAELAPNDPKPLEALARLYRRAQETDKAIEMHLKLADLHQRLGKPKSMVHEWDNAVRLRPSLVELQAKIAHEHEAQGDTKRATQSWLRLADYWQEQNDPEKSLQAVHEALRVNPQHTRALELLEGMKDR